MFSKIKSCKNLEAIFFTEANIKCLHNKGTSEVMPHGNKSKTKSVLHL